MTITSLHSTRRIDGLTHNFYRYPARMPSDLARELVLTYSEPGDTIFDPFMGGGTTIVEALANGRRSVGLDLNAIAHFVTTVKTTPLSANDRREINEWAKRIYFDIQLPNMVYDGDERIFNLPREVVNRLTVALGAIDTLPFPRQKQFARCVLLKLGQWAVDNRSTMPPSDRWNETLDRFLADMLRGMDELVDAAAASGIAKNKITSHRDLLLRNVIGSENGEKLSALRDQSTLIVTSPPYPSTHILYHRWQVKGRRETPAPYWLIDAPNGHGASYFTLGGRHLRGQDGYFQNLVAAYRSIASIVHPGTLLVQLVAFSNESDQLPRFLSSMHQAGFVEEELIDRQQRQSVTRRLWRSVPNRKWYTQLSEEPKPKREILLIHRSK